MEGTQVKPKIVMTVCNGNIHRSVIAQLCLSRELKRLGKESAIRIISRGLQGSAGTTSPNYPQLKYYGMEQRLSQPYLDKIGIVIPPTQRATPIDAVSVEQSILILAMDQAVLNGRENSLVCQFPDYVAKMRLFSELIGRTEDVPDCGGSADADLYQQVIESIDYTAKKVYST